MWIIAALVLYAINFFVLVVLNIIFARMIILSQQDADVSKLEPMLSLSVVVSLTLRIVCFMEGIKIIVVYWIIGSKRNKKDSIAQEEILAGNGYEENVVNTSYV